MRTCRTTYSVIRMEVGIDNAHHRHGGQRRVGEEVVGAGAEREDRFEIVESGEQPRRRMPHTRIVHARGIADLVGPHAYAVLRRERPESLLPALRVPADDRKQNVRHRWWVE